MNVVLWIIQGLRALLVLFAGGVKLIMPIEEMTRQMALPGWPLAFGADQFETNTASSGLSLSKIKVFSDPFYRSVLIRDRLWLT
jgi:hypothetical protein